MFLLFCQHFVNQIFKACPKAWLPPLTFYRLDAGRFAWSPECFCGQVCAVHILVMRPFPPAWSHGCAADYDSQILESPAHVLRYD